MAKAINGHSARKSGMAMAINNILVAPPLNQDDLVMRMSASLCIE